MDNGMEMEKNHWFTPFFSTQEIQASIKKALETFNSDERAELNKKFDARITTQSRLTYICLDYFLINPKFTDEHCQYCIEIAGDSLKKALQDFAPEPSNYLEALESLAAILYQFLTELTVSAPPSLARQLTEWQSAIKESDFSNETNKRIYHYAQQGLTTGILKKYIRRKELVTLSGLPELLRTGEKFREDLEQSLDKRTKEVQKLKDHLDNYEKNFNFLGLNRAFRSMRALKLKEAKTTFIFLITLGICMLLPLSTKAYYDFSYTPSILETVNQADASSTESHDHPISTVEPGTNKKTEKPANEKEKIKANDDQATKYFKQLSTLLIILGLELVLLYFFKVTLHNYRSVKAQLLQIDLRVALTQFILKYSEYVNNSSASSAGTLERFEQVIFSGIVNGDSEIPSTFDGLDQVIKVLEKVRPS